MTQPYLIANMRTGLERDMEPWLIPEDAFPDLEDCYMFRGRIQRRRGYFDLGRIVTGVVSEASGTVTTPWTSFSGTLTNTVISPGSVSIVVGTLTFVDTPTTPPFPPLSQTGTLSAGGANTGTINYLSGAFTLTINPALIMDTAVVSSYEYYPLNPVMGLRTRELTTLNEEQLIGFDTVKANRFSNVNNRFQDITFYKTTSLAFSWTGQNYNFFWTTNYLNAFWTTNIVKGFQIRNITGITAAASAVVTVGAGHPFQVNDLVGFTNVAGMVEINGLTGTVTAIAAATITVNINSGGFTAYASGGFAHSLTRTISGDGIRWYDGTGWINFSPPVDSTTVLMGCLLIVSYRNRLVVLNTTEGSAIGTFTNYAQRARWSQNGTPYYVNTVPSGFTGGSNADAWRGDIVGRGGFIDAPTQEQIVSAEFYKDSLVVFFERSTWQLRYTGNETLPFIWERINIELGAESAFSIVPFDSGIVAVGNYGVVSCDATGVKRIDQIIPDEVFDIHNGNNGPLRVYGIRDFVQQLVYWTFPNDAENPTFPNRVLVYNYLDGSYSFFNDSLTCFGTYQPFNDTTWADLRIPWNQFPHSWSEAGLQSDFPMICAGNQQGWVFKDFNNGPIMNDPSLQITGATNAVVCVITSPNHNLLEGTFILIKNVLGMTEINGTVYKVSAPTTNTFIIQTLDANENWINVDSTAFGAYTAKSGTISVRNNFNILSKRFNPFLSNGGQVRLQNVDLFVEESSDTEFTLSILLDENANTTFETDVVAPTSPTLGKVWIRTYISVIGQFAQLQLHFDDLQMVTQALSEGDVTLHALMLWMSPGGRLTYGTMQ